jgi:hypothetical protein
MCQICESPPIEIRGKLVCPFCHIILETCCEGGRCDYAKETADNKTDNKTEEQP